MEYYLWFVECASSIESFLFKCSEGSLELSYSYVTNCFFFSLFHSLCSAAKKKVRASLRHYMSHLQTMEHDSSAIFFPNPVAFH